MKLSDAARLATVGETRVYQTKTLKPVLVVVTSAEVDARGSLWVTVRRLDPVHPFDDTPFAVRVQSLSIPEAGGE